MRLTSAAQFLHRADTAAERARRRVLCPAFLALRTQASTLAGRRVERAFFRRLALAGAVRVRDANESRRTLAAALARHWIAAALVDARLALAGVVVGRQTLLVRRRASTA